MRPQCDLCTAPIPKLSRPLLSPLAIVQWFQSVCSPLASLPVHILGTSSRPPPHCILHETDCNPMQQAVHVKSWSSGWLESTLNRYSEALATLCLLGYANVHDLAHLL